MTTIKNSHYRDFLLSLLFYVLPVTLMFAWFYISGQEPWNDPVVDPLLRKGNTESFKGIVTLVFENLRTWGLPVLVLIWSATEFLLGLYGRQWSRNDKFTDIASLIIPRFTFAPLVALFSLYLLPALLPGVADKFAWIPFWWGFFIIAVADDLTNFWYHRLHHEIPFLWRFHRTHHSAPYMAAHVNNRQNIFYVLFLSQFYVVATLTYLGLGYPALFFTGIKSVIATAAHSNILWDKPLYRFRLLHPLAWIIERTIVTPATHHAHHADSNDGIGHYKGNFGNLFFIWDVIFKTGIITRKYPSGYGLKYGQDDEWYAQIFWPLLKSSKAGSELSKDGPEVYKETVSVSPEAVV
jgi:sterol desaturase/sphingolipid hydroxylase (fatty acid hydroxylase superfamily)